MKGLITDDIRPKIFYNQQFLKLAPIASFTELWVSNELSKRDIPKTLNHGFY